jgi:hypothetical protein
MTQSLYLPNSHLTLRLLLSTLSTLLQSPSIYTWKRSYLDNNLETVEGRNYDDPFSNETLPYDLDNVDW